MAEKKLTHIDSSGNARMVDVGGKEITKRTAVAKGEVVMLTSTLDLVRKGQIKKGDVLTVSKVAGITAAKKTAELIPFCHSIPLDQIEIEFELADSLPGVLITATAKTSARTGVEMEALTAVTVAALSIYDMAKAVEKTMVIQNIRLIKKTGGASGDVENE